MIWGVKVLHIYIYHFNTSDQKKLQVYISNIHQLHQQQGYIMIYPLGTRDILWYIPWESVVMVTNQEYKFCFNVHIYTFHTWTSLYSIFGNVMDYIFSLLYRIPGIFRGMYISRLSAQSGFSQIKFCGWGYPKFSRFSRLIACVTHVVTWPRRVYITISSEIDKAPYRAVAISQSTVDAVNSRFYDTTTP